VRRPDRLPGLDLTFSPPKSVCLLFALCDGETASVVRRAHDAAVAQARGYLEREAGEVRRGKDGVDRLPGGGFVAAAFRHRTSRAGDPQLHSHVLVANMTRGADGRWFARRQAGRRSTPVQDRPQVLGGHHPGQAQPSRGCPRPPPGRLTSPEPR
jgi:conjugative relaxase-like TrwC/TraI family protein